MGVSLSFHGINEISRPGVRELFEQHAGRINRHLGSFNPDLVRMEGRIEKSPHHHLYRVSLRLKLPSGVLATAAEDHELRPVLRDAFAELERRAERHLARLQRAHLWKRVSRRIQLHRLKEGRQQVGQQGHRRVLHELIQPYLESLYGYVSRELRYLEASGDPQPGALESADLVAGTLLRALEKMDDRPQHVNLKDWLLSLAHEELERARREARPAHSTEAPERLSAEEPPPDEERDGYWEPEEQLKLEDLIPEPSDAPPEEVAGQRDVQRALLRAVSALPRQWRQTILLTLFDNLSVAQASRVLAIPEARVNETLQHAHAFLEQRLADAGFGYPPSGGHLLSAARVGRAGLPAQEQAELLGALLGPDEHMR